MPKTLRFEWPAPLPNLTISIVNLLRHPSLHHLPVSKLCHTNPSRFRITGVDLSATTLECLVHVESGEVFVWKFAKSQDQARGSEQQQQQQDHGGDGGDYLEGARGGGSSSDKQVELLTSVTHLANRRDDGFKPVTILTTRRGPVVATAMSDIGELMPLEVH